MNSIQVKTESQNDTNEVKECKVIEINLENPFDNLYAVVTPVKIKEY